MPEGDFYGSEVSTTVPAATSADIDHFASGEKTTLKSGIALQAGEIIDAARMNMGALKAFLAEQVAEAKEQGVLFSLHMKATMMKVSDPIIFGACVEVFADVFEKYATDSLIWVLVRNGLGMHTKIANLDDEAHN